MLSEPRRESLSAAELCALMEEVFRAGGVFSFAPLGRSMLPMLREKRDLVVLADGAGREIRKYDVILYQRVEEDGREHPVLHRVIGFDRDGMVLCGDAQVLPEHGVRREQVLGVLVAFVRKGKRISVESRGYRAYAVLWTAIRPLRRVVGAVKARFFRFFVDKREKS